VIQQEGEMSEQKYIDLSRIEKHILLENHLLMLVVPTQSGRGYVPLRIAARDKLFYYLYDPIQEGAFSGPVPPSTSINGVTDLGWQSPVLFGSKNISGQPPNVLRVTEYSHLYQVFFGIAPSHARVFINAPSQTGQGELDIYGWGESYNAFGWIDGFDSPLYSPSPASELIIPPEFDVAFGIANPLPVPISPLFNFVINRVQVEVVTDADLVTLMLNRKVYVKYYTLGGLGGFSYDITKYYNIRSPVFFGMSPAQIKSALSPKT